MNLNISVSFISRLLFVFASENSDIILKFLLIRQQLLVRSM